MGYNSLIYVYNMIRVYVCHLFYPKSGAFRESTDPTWKDSKVCQVYIIWKKSKCENNENVYGERKMNHHQALDLWQTCPNIVPSECTFL